MPRVKTLILENGKWVDVPRQWPVERFAAWLVLVDQMAKEATR